MEGNFGGWQHNLTGLSSCCPHKKRKKKRKRIINGDNGENLTHRRIKQIKFNKKTVKRHMENKIKNYHICIRVLVPANLQACLQALHRVKNPQKITG